MTEWTKEMMDAEVIECARYGEEEDLRALLTDGADANSADIGGTSALHKAAANGHVSCLEILKSFGANHVPNEGGNLPVHWAVQNGQLAAFEFLAANYDINVLAKNALGQSTLSEAFTKGIQSLLEACLAHPSSSEEALLAQTGGGGGGLVGGLARAGAEGQDDVDEEEGEEYNAAAETGDGSSGSPGRTVFSTATAKAKAQDLSYDVSNAVTHAMDLRATRATDGLQEQHADTDAGRLSRGRPLFVRELPIYRADNPFGTDVAPQDDTTGLGLWPATVLCARWVASEEISATLYGKVVVELGAGCGLPGLAAAYYSGARSVYITDIHENTLKNAVFNMHLNSDDAATTSLSGVREEKTSPSCAISGVPVGRQQQESPVPTAVHILNVSWTDPTTYPPEKADVIIGSDLVYDHDILSVLGPAVFGMLRNGGTFLYVAPDEMRAGMAGIVETFAQLRLICVSRTPCTDDMYGNPLVKPSVCAAAPAVANDKTDVDDDFVLHFYDLARKQSHTLYTFVKIEAP